MKVIQLKKGVEEVIRKIYNFDKSIDISDVTVTFKAATKNMNGLIKSVIKDAKEVIDAATPTGGRRQLRRKPNALRASMSLHREYTTSPEDIACMRSFFCKWRKVPELLTGEHEHFVAQTTGVRYPNLSQETKSRMREIFEEIRTKVLMARTPAMATS